MNQKISHICYADDDADDHFIFKTVLKEVYPSIRLTSFYRCDSLVAYLRDDSQSLPDLIFLDYNMPGNDGNECLGFIKGTARLYHIPAIIYSTSNALLHIQSAYKYGAYMYLVKPASLDEIKYSIQQVISGLEAKNTNVNV